MMSDAKKVHNYCANLENLAMPFRGEQGIDNYVKGRNLILLVSIRRGANDGKVSVSGSFYNYINNRL